jgi:hypothetical protein
MQRQQWFAMVNGLETGPLTPNELRVLAKEGKVQAGTLVRLSGGEWVAASSVRGLFSAKESVPKNQPQTEQKTQVTSTNEVTLKPISQPEQKQTNHGHRLHPVLVMIGTLVVVAVIAVPVKLLLFNQSNQPLAVDISPSTSSETSSQAIVQPAPAEEIDSDTTTQDFAWNDDAQPIEESKENHPTETDDIGDTVSGLLNSFQKRREAEEAEEAAAKASEDLYNSAIELSKTAETSDDKTEIFEMIREAAWKEYQPAMIELSYCFETGYGVSQDLPRSVFWLRKAADLDNPRAMCLLAAKLCKGEGVPVNEEKAYGWVRRAADLGYEPAQKVLRDFAMETFLTALFSASDGETLDEYDEAKDNAAAAERFRQSEERLNQQRVYWEERARREAAYDD